MYTQFHDRDNELRVMNTDGSADQRVLKGNFPNKVDWGVHP